MPMIYRNLIGQNHCSSGLIGMSDAGSGKQVKESKSSERKNTQMSLIFHLIFLCSTHAIIMRNMILTPLVKL